MGGPVIMRAPFALHTCTHSATTLCTLPLPSSPTLLPQPQGSAYEREQLSGEVSRKYSQAAKALHGQESMEGVAGARSRPVTGENSMGTLCGGAGHDGGNEGVGVGEGGGARAW